MKNRVIFSLINRTFLLSFSVLFLSVIPFISGKCIQRNSNSGFCLKLNRISKPTRLIEASFRKSLEFIVKTKAIGYISNTEGVSKQPNFTKERFKEYQPGFEFYYEKGSRPDAGYILVSGFNPDANDQIPSVQLWDLNNQKLIHEFQHDNKLKDIYKLKRAITLYNPLIDENGNLIFNLKEKGNLVKIDQCGKILKISNNSPRLKFHHSIQKDENGYIYTANELKDFDNLIHRRDFKNHGFSILDKDLNVIYSTTLLEIYEKNGLLNDIYSMESIPRDPFHLNKVEPFIRSDGKLVVLLSIRNQSNIMAVEVESKKIIWIIENLLSKQHDVDIIGNKNDLLDVTIFDNNVWNYKTADRYILKEKVISKGNRVIKFYNLPTYPKEDIIFISTNKQYQNYDFEIIDFKWMKEKLQPNTLSAGLADLNKANNSLMVEETNYGRLFEIDLETKDILWQYINKKDKDSVPFYMQWSRSISEFPNVINNDEFNACKIN